MFAPEQPSCIETLARALGARTLSGVDRCLDPAVEVVLVAPDIPVAPNDHLWRAVHLNGRDEAFDYLRELYRVLPAIDISFQPGRVDINGVDADGAPFRAAADIVVEVGDHGISKLRATVRQVEAGAELLRGEDPRRYLRAFLAAGRQTVTLRGGRTNDPLRMSAA